MKKSRLMKIFEQFIKKFDMNNINVRTKYFHSLKTMELSREIASELDILDEEEIMVCELIGLFHEIGSFQETYSYHMIDDDNEDYSMKTIELLFDKGLMRKITDSTKYDSIIKMALYCHNKNGLPSQLDSKTVTFCKIIKDAHKIETLRMVINYPYMDMKMDTYPSQNVYNDFRLFRTINSKIGENNADNVLIVLSNLFSLGYKESYNIVKENDYITKMIDTLKFDSKEIEEFFVQIGKVMNKYIDRKVEI